MQKATAGYRVSTGPVQFDNDWPGYFYRGDDTFNIVGLLNYVADMLESDLISEGDLVTRLRREAASLKGCWLEGGIIGGTKEERSESLD